MTEMLEYILPICSASNLFFCYYIELEINYVVLATLICAVVHALLPLQKFNEQCFKLPEPEPNTQRYSEVYQNFDVDYKRSNPATAERAIKDFMDMKQKGLIEEKLAAFDRKNAISSLEMLEEEDKNEGTSEKLDCVSDFKEL